MRRLLAAGLALLMVAIPTAQAEWGPHTAPTGGPLRVPAGGRQRGA